MLVKTYYKSELASMYEMTLKTFMKQVNLLVEKGILQLEKNAKLLLPYQVKAIVTAIGAPQTEIDFEN